MCVAVPARILKIEDEWAQADLGGTSFKINIMLTPGLCVGDYVLVHAGFSIERMDEQKGQETLKILEGILC
ncbi:MAG: HypC/HybG/HupF family hydrogenase formation chaperone [Tepidanaerobacteraceae bacterium]|jgi:hydrogenase expression/formation protein HypC|nr:HypC/HybG/HupF family hydrogenase formation chaperone [Tepidanaerobacteraceae bacterium]